MEWMPLLSCADGDEPWSLLSFVLVAFALTDRPTRGETAARACAAEAPGAVAEVLVAIEEDPPSSCLYV